MEYAIFNPEGGLLELDADRFEHLMESINEDEKMSVYYFCELYNEFAQLASQFIRDVDGPDEAADEYDRLKQSILNAIEALKMHVDNADELGRKARISAAKKLVEHITKCLNKE